MSEQSAAFYRQQVANEEHYDRLQKDAIKNQFRQSLIQKFGDVSTRIGQAIQTGQIFDPMTSQMRPMSDAEKAEYSKANEEVNTYIRHLNDPNFDIQKGITPGNPIHTLMSHLHLMKPQQRPPAQQISDLQGIVQKYGPLPGEEEAQAFSATQNREDAAWPREQKRLEAAGFTPEEIEKKRNIDFGLEAKSSLGSDYKQGLRRFVKSKGGDPDNPTWEEEAEFRKLRGTAGKPKVGWSRDKSGKYYSFQLDDKNQKIPGTENYEQVPPASIAGSISNGFTTFTDSNGNVWRIPETRTHVPLGQPATGEGKPTAPPKPPGEQKSDLKNITEKHKAPEAAAAPTTPPAPVHGATYLGNKGTPNLREARSTYHSAIVRDKIMHANAEEAKHGNQQAMVSILMNHIGMTLGIQKGTRVTQTIINDAQASDDTWSRMVARLGIGTIFDENSVGGLFPRGVVLDDKQIDQMVGLADHRVQVSGEDLNQWEKESSLPLTPIWKHEGSGSTGQTPQMSDREFLEKVGTNASPK